MISHESWFIVWCNVSFFLTNKNIPCPTQGITFVSQYSRVCYNRNAYYPEIELLNVIATLADFYLTV